MTPADLDQSLSTVPAEAPLIFETRDGAIGPGYHVTEWKLARIDGIDCGAKQSSWREARLQLLDGQRGDYMKIGTFRGILRKSIEALPDLGDSPVQVEFAHGNGPMGVFEMAGLREDDGAVRITLGGISAACKPLLAAQSTPRAANAPCCGPSKATAHSCC